MRLTGPPRLDLDTAGYVAACFKWMINVHGVAGQKPGFEAE